MLVRSQQGRPGGTTPECTTTTVYNNRDASMGSRRAASLPRILGQCRLQVQAQIKRERRGGVSAQDNKRQTERQKEVHVGSEGATRHCTRTYVWTLTSSIAPNSATTTNRHQQPADRQTDTAAAATKTVKHVGVFLLGRTNKYIIHHRMEWNTVIFPQRVPSRL